MLYIWGAKEGKMRDSEKVYSKEELLNYLYKYGNIPVILFAKDKEGKYVYASENPEKINWINGDEFLMIIPKCGEKKCDEIIQQINQQQNIKKETDPYVDIAMGAAVRKIKKAQMKFRQGDPDTGLSVGDVLRTDMSMSLKQAFEIADKKMYQDKNSYKKFHIVTKYRK